MLIDDTKTLVNQLFRTGITSNENLHTLLSNLQKILDAANDQKQNSQVEYLGQLANLYRPTNASNLPPRILRIQSLIDEMRNKVIELAVNIPEQIPNLMNEQSNAELVSNFSRAVIEQTQYITEEAERTINDWLIEMRY